MIAIKGAKTEWQRKRNANLQKAETVLKKDLRTQGQVCKIAWQMPGNKQRAVTVGDVVAFVQEVGEQSGKFTGIFENCSF